MDNHELYETALEAIGKLFGDRSVSTSEARQNLESLIDEIRIMLDSLDE
jgi:hypothetical protein